MNTVKTWQTQSTSSDATEKLGELAGSNLRGGETLELRGDLGSGKTTFVRGLAKGLGSKDKVTSPSFTVSKLYKAGDRTLHHFDFYRLHEPGIMLYELSELASNKDDVVVVEWADSVLGELPEDRVVITFKTIGENARNIEFGCSAAKAYMLKGLK